jgi:ABC-type branched-subunit amino acid transport system ATPase component
MTSEKTPVLRLSSLFAGYGRFDVVRDVDLRVEEGEAVALLGPNGAGKTTVLRAIMGLVKHRRGTIRVGNADVSSLPSYRIARGLAAIAPEGRRLFLDQSVEDNLIWALCTCGATKNACRTCWRPSTTYSRYCWNTGGDDLLFSAAASSRWLRSAACS